MALMPMAMPGHSLLNDEGPPDPLCPVAALRAAQQAAEASNLAKSLYLARISHEFRTPLNGILGFAELLQSDGRLDDQQRHAADMIRLSGEHLLALVNDILDLAKFEAGRLELNPRQFELGAMLHVVIDIIRVRAARKPGLRLDVDLAQDLPTHVYADDLRLRQVLLNLLDNAVKFTEAGVVTLRLEVVGPARLRCIVDDTGSSLSAAQRGQLFQPFEQVGNLAQRCQGTGLGLVVSRQIVRLMGGDLRAEARPGGGNRFGFEIDLGATAA